MDLGVLHTREAQVLGSWQFFAEVLAVPRPEPLDEGLRSDDQVFGGFLALLNAAVTIVIIILLGLRGQHVIEE